jgi:DNA polymerase V
MTARELAKTIIDDVRETVGTVSTCGIGTNLYLAKIALDLHAKHAADFIAELDEDSYREKLWDHKPITDFWQIASGKAERLRNHGITTMRDIAMMKEDFLYDWFGIDAELLIDHAWGREPTTIADIKNYKSKSKSLSSSQVLMRDYKFQEAEIIAKEMVYQLCLDMAAKRLVTDSISLYVGYSYTEGVAGSGGTAQFARLTNLATEIIPAISALYRRIVNPSYVIRRVGLSCNNVISDPGVIQLNMFEDTTKQLRDKALQEALLDIRAKYGKNSILKGISYTEAATGRIRNNQIGGHKSGTS